MVAIFAAMLYNNICKVVVTVVVFHSVPNAQTPKHPNAQTPAGAGGQAGRRAGGQAIKTPTLRQYFKPREKKKKWQKKEKK